MTIAKPRRLGIVKPSNRPGKAEELVALLPPGSVEVLQEQLNIEKGAPEELRAGVQKYDPLIRILAEAGAELVHPAGAPPLLLGYEGEQRRIREWEALAGVPVFTNGSSQVNALRAFGAKKIVGLSYFPGAINDSFARYYQEAGFDVLTMVGMDVEFQQVPKVPQADLHAFVRKHLGRHPSADALYLLGPAWKTLDLIAGWEQEYGIPVVHHIPAQSWEIQRRLGLHHPVQGYGRLLAELPALAG